jgi:hypothetical protein
MRLKARGLAQHGGPPGWLERSDPAGVLLYVMDGPYCLHCKEICIYVIQKMELRGLSLNFHIYVSVSDLYIWSIYFPAVE